MSISPRTATSDPRVIVLIPNANGGVYSLFQQFAPLKTGSTSYFYTHGNSKLSIFLFPFRVLNFTWKLISHRVDLCHANVAITGSTIRKVILCSICRLLSVPYVIHLHGSEYREFYDSLGRINHWIVTRFFLNAAGIIVLGEVWRDWAIDTVGVAPSRVHVLMNAVFAPKVLETRLHDLPHILFLGRLGVRKGLPELIDALASPEMAEHHWRATIAGDGDLAMYREQVGRLNLANVAIVGWVDRVGAGRLLQSSDILVLPSRAENLPLSMLEGMGYGLCPVVTPVGAVPEVIQDGHNGLIVPIRDSKALAVALARVVGDSALRRRLGRQARIDFERHYNIADYRSRLIALYKRVLGQTTT